MGDWERVCSAHEVDQQPVRFTLRAGADIVLVRNRGELLAMSNRCPHKEASLHRSGDIEDLGGDLGLCLRCPKHRSKFGGGLYVSFSTGRCTTRTSCSKSERVSRWTVPVYDTKEEQGRVYVRPRAAGEERESLRSHPEIETMVSQAPRAAAAAGRLDAEVVRIRQVSPDSFNIMLLLLHRSDRAAFAHEPAVMWHIWLHVQSRHADGRAVSVSREYTPVSSAEQTASTGTIELVIKLYANGEMSNALAALRVADRVAVSPPRTTLQLPALEEAAATGQAAGQSFNLLAGGTGIAPCLQLARRALCAAAPVRLVYSVRRREDLLLADELAQLAHSGGLRYALVLSQEGTAAAAADVWSSDTRPEEPTKRPRTTAAVCGRRVDEAVVREHLIGMDEEGNSEGKAEGPRMPVVTVISGPSGFNEHCEGLARRLAHVDAQKVFVLDA